MRVCGGAIGSASFDGEAGGVAMMVWTTKRWALFLAASLLVRAALAASVPLSGDEAYYWDCSRHLDWSYFDQPALAIWTMIPFRALLGETVLAVRAPTLLASVLLGVCLERLIRRLGGTLADAAWAYALLHATPLFFLGSGYASTDAMLVAAYVGATWAAVAVAQGDGRAWWGLGLALGLGFLAKFPVVVILPIFVPILLQPAARAHLRRPTPYLAGALGLALTAPVWIWGARHGWDNIAFQLARVPSGFEPANALRFWGANAFMVTPFLGLAMLTSWLGSSGRRGGAWQTYRVATAMPLLFFTVVAVRGHVGMHWGAPSLVLGVVAVVLAGSRWHRSLIPAGLATGGATIAVLLSVVWLPRPWLDLETWVRGMVAVGHEPRRPELAELFGVDEIAREVRDRLEPGELAATEDYADVHLVAFAMAGEVRTHLGRISTGKHGLGSLYWYPADALRDRDFLFFTEDARTPERLERLFREIHEERPLVVHVDGRPVRTVRFLRCRGLRHARRAFTRLDIARGVRRDGALVSVGALEPEKLGRQQRRSGG